MNILQIDRSGSRLLAVTSEADLYLSERGDITSWEPLDLEIEECDAVGVSLEHDLLAVALDGRLHIRPLQDEGQRKSIIMNADLNSYPGAVYSVTFSPSGDRLVCIYENNIVIAWDTRPSDSDELDERPLFATQNKRVAFGNTRFQRSEILLTSTGLSHLLIWDALDLRCIGELSLRGLYITCWDSSSDGSKYYTSLGNLIRVYDYDYNYDIKSRLASSCRSNNRLRDIRLDERIHLTEVKSCSLKNRALDIRLDERSGLLIIMENTPSLICLDAKTLNVVSSIKLEDHGEFAIAPLDGNAVVVLDEQCRLIIRRLPNLEPIDIIDIWDAMARSENEEIRHMGAAGKEGTSYIMLPEFTQLETFRIPDEIGNYAALIVAEIAGLNKECFSLTATVDLSEGVATMAFRDVLGDAITGIAVDPKMDRFFQSTLSGCLHSRELSTGRYIESVEPIPNITLVNADFRGAEFETDELRNMVRASGAIVDDAPT